LRGYIRDIKTIPLKRWFERSSYPVWGANAGISDYAQITLLKEKSNV